MSRLLINLFLLLPSRESTCRRLPVPLKIMLSDYYKRDLLGELKPCGHRIIFNHHCAALDCGNCSIVTVVKCGQPRWVQ